MKAEGNKTVHNLYAPKMPRSYSINEILAAGGSTSFATKLGKKPEKIDKRIAALPDNASLTPEELKDALDILNKQK